MIQEFLIPGVMVLPFAGAMILGVIVWRKRFRVKNERLEKDIKERMRPASGSQRRVSPIKGHYRARSW